MDIRYLAAGDQGRPLVLITGNDDDGIEALQQAALILAAGDMKSISSKLLKGFADATAHMTLSVPHSAFGYYKPGISVISPTELQWIITQEEWAQLAETLKPFIFEPEGSKVLDERDGSPRVMLACDEFGATS